MSKIPPQPVETTAGVVDALAQLGGGQHVVLVWAGAGGSKPVR